METIQLEVDKSGVAVLKIDVLDRSMNVFTPELENDLRSAVECIVEDDTILGAVLTSGKSNGFIAGADLRGLVNVCGNESLKQAYERSARPSALLRRIETCGKPVACAINGLALGGGLELALACHYRILLDDPRSIVGLPEVKVGLLPAGGGTQRLPRLIGIPAALEILLSGAPLSPAKALSLGIVDDLGTAGELVAKAGQWVLAHRDAQPAWDTKGFKVPGGTGCLANHATESFQVGTSIQARQTQRNYPAPLAILSAVFEGTQVPMDTGLRIESKYFARLLVGPVARNLMRTMFINKGAADKLIRRPSGVPSSRVKTLGILGAGMMGAGIARVSAEAGIDVVLLDATQEEADSGKYKVQSSLERKLGKGQITQDRLNEILQGIAATSSFEHLEHCDLVIEAVFESRKVKLEVLRKAEAVINTSAMLASNTSTLPITGLAKTCNRPFQFIGLHFFSPVEQMPLVEIIAGRQTDEATIAKAMDFVRQLRKTPIVVNDGPGFYTSRIFMAYIDEGMAMLEEGTPPALIENAAKLAGMPVGPLAVTDEVSLDLQERVILQAEADGLPKRFRRLHSRNVIERMMDMGRHGRRCGGGFYEYPEKARKYLWPGLKDLFPPGTDPLDVKQVSERLLTIQALEAVRCLEEGVIQHPADADLGAILGVGYPSWTGGPLSYIETVGAKDFVRQCKWMARKHGTRFRPSKSLIATDSDSAPWFDAIQKVA